MPRSSCSSYNMRKVLKLLLIVSLLDYIFSFKPLFPPDGSLSHRHITQKAILMKTAEVCRDVAASDGRDFNLTIDDNLSADNVQRACSSAGTSNSYLSTLSFQTSITNIYLSNAIVDQLFVLSARHHFDDETFQEGRDIITAGLSDIKTSVKEENFITGRVTLGVVCHTLQDFYSHSNWVELGRTAPYSALIRPDQPLQNLAGPTTPTCRNCTGGSCEDNLLPEVLKQELLTSGYFSPLFSSKPAGKCSHGGFVDQTSGRDPVGGINKDDSGSSHGSLHHTAADLAVRATAELLQDIRLAVGDKTFLRFMGLSFAPVLCFVIDTTGSMSDDIDEAKKVSYSIIDGRRGTELEPPSYILVPFNDPDFGPLTKTQDADVFKQQISELFAHGGGDEPELCLSGLLLALTAAPPNSEIFVFTDASAKDFYLKSTITALIESTKTKVTFMLTNFLARPCRRSQQVNQCSIVPSDTQLYRELAQASGGQTIEVPKLSLSQATTVIEDSSAIAVVTVFQAVVDPGRPENFTFPVDSSLGNVIAYITGFSVVSFSVTSPTGLSQSSSEPSGPLANITATGNLHRLKLSTETQSGLWQISVNSLSSYSVKVTGQSSVNFIYNLVASYEGAHGDFSLVDGRPLSGNNISLLVSVTGSDQIKVTEVTLFDSSGPTEANGSLQSVGSGSFLVTFIDIPAGDYVVTLRGEVTSSTSKSLPISMQRQASTKIRTTNFSVTAKVNKTNIEPGSTISIPFTEATTSKGASRLFRVTDVSRPVCQEVSTDLCPSSSSLCASSQWVFIANITDGINGTGIESITIIQGNGSLSTSTVAGAGGENVTVATYNASCCSLSVELAVVDSVGNVGTCVGQARVNTTSTAEPSVSTTVTVIPATVNATSTAEPTVSTTVTVIPATVNTTSTAGPTVSTTVTVIPATVNTTSTAGPTVIRPTYLLISVLVFFFWK